MFDLGRDIGDGRRVGLRRPVTNPARPWARAGLDWEKEEAMAMATGGGTKEC